MDGPTPKKKKPCEKNELPEKATLATSTGKKMVAKKKKKTRGALEDGRDEILKLSQPKHEKKAKAH